MTICAAKNCRNTSLKGVKMCYFPSDSEQRANGTNIGRENWLSNKHSALCEVILFNLIVIYYLQN